jgi:hypothetical protein
LNIEVWTLRITINRHSIIFYHKLKNQYGKKFDALNCC